MDYYSAQNYFIEIWSELDQGCYYSCNTQTQAVRDGWTYGYSGSASWSDSAPVSNTWFTVWAEPAVVTYYDTLIGCVDYWDDVYGYSLLGTDIGDPSIYEYPTGPYEYTVTQVILLDAAWQAVFAAPPCAYPVNPLLIRAYDNGFGQIVEQYVWQSSDGVTANLSSCRVGEYVAYPSNANPYFPQSPPFPNSFPFVGYPNPTTGYSYEVNAANGIFSDSHGIDGTFVTPFPIGHTSFDATQYYYFSCPCRNGGLPVRLYPTDGSLLTITRSVDAIAPNSGTFTVVKSDTSLLFGVSSSKAVP